MSGSAGCLAFALPSACSALGQILGQHRGRQAAAARDQAREMGGELAVGAVVDDQQQALQVRDEALGLELLALQPLLLGLAERHPRQAQRSIGGIAMVVTNAMVTIMVNRFWLSAPIDSPMVATITSVEPRAFMPQASASASAPRQPADLAADEGAGELADAGDRDQAERQQQKLRVLQDREIGAQAGQCRRTPA